MLDDDDSDAMSAMWCGSRSTILHLQCPLPLLLNSPHHPAAVLPSLGVMLPLSSRLRGSNSAASLTA